jgi:hypothetical protein
MSRPPYQWGGPGAAPSRASVDVAVLAVCCGILLAATGLTLAGMWLLRAPGGLGMAAKLVVGEVATGLVGHQLRRLWKGSW